ncbi:MAG: nucleotide sugar dehydrogenase [Candidatus Neomarinimicrobiota bacterium]
MEEKTISVIGLGKLGAAIAASIAHKGILVIGADVNSASVEKINDGLAPVEETGLQELISANRSRLRATLDVEEAVLESELALIFVPTPSNSEGGFSTEYVVNACQDIGRAIGRKDTYQLVVLCSTVLPGATQNEVLPALENASGKRCGQDFGLCYSPEFIALGSVIDDFLNPDIMLIGESDSRAGDILEDFYSRVYTSRPVVRRMNFVNAELTKIAVNTYLTTKISFANMLADICERLPAGNVDAVTNALGMDSRIGPKYLKGATGYGGPCFPRDNRAMVNFIRSIGLPPLLPEAVDAVNQLQVQHMAEWVQRCNPQRKRIGILGLSYKPETPVVDESQGLLLAQALVKEGLPVTVYDPQGMDDARDILGEAVRYAQTAENCVRQCGVIVLTTPWPEFKRLSPDCFQKMTPPRAILDGWRILDGEVMSQLVDYYARGKGADI